MQHPPATQHPLPVLCHPQQYEKKQIYLHHTVSSPNPYNVADWWVEQHRHTGFKIATAYIIAGAPNTPDAPYKDGEIIQIFPHQNWAAHLGKPTQTPGTNPLPATTLHKHSIAIELCNWGYVRQLPAANFVSGTGSIIRPENVIALNYREKQYWHRYTAAQIESLRQLLLHLTSVYDIPRTYNPMFSICPEALHGQPGIFSHTSVRIDKTDISPQPAMVKMLQELNAKQS